MYSYGLIFLRRFRFLVFKAYLALFSLLLFSMAAACASQSFFALAMVSVILSPVYSNPSKMLFVSSCNAKKEAQRNENEATLYVKHVKYVGLVQG